MGKALRTTTGYFGPKNNPNNPLLPKSIKRGKNKNKLSNSIGRSVIKRGAKNGKK